MVLASLSGPGLVVASVLRPPAAGSSAARAVFERFVDLLYHRQQVRAAFESCVAREAFVDHGGFRSRAAAMSALAPQLGPGGQAPRVLHTVFEGDIGMVHLVPSVLEGDAPARPRVEIFRVADERIVEHWSVAAGGAG